MKFGIHIGHMGGPLGEMRKLWKFADAKGFDWFSVSDHFQESPPRGGDMDCYEAIATLTAAAMDTQRIRLGSGVYCVVYRNPGLLAKSLTTIDHLSNGRVDCGLGAGWHDVEAKAFGYPVPVHRPARGHARGVRADHAPAPRSGAAARELRGEALPRDRRPEQPQAAAAPHPHLDRRARREAHAPGGREVRRRVERRLHRPRRLEAQGPGARPVVREGRARPEDDHAHREPRVLPRGRREGRGARARRCSAATGAAAPNAPPAPATCAAR